MHKQKYTTGSTAAFGKVHKAEFCEIVSRDKKHQDTETTLPTSENNCRNIAQDTNFDVLKPT